MGTKSHTDSRERCRTFSRLFSRKNNKVSFSSGDRSNRMWWRDWEHFAVVVVNVVVVVMMVSVRVEDVMVVVLVVGTQ